MAEKNLICRGKSKDVIMITEGTYAGKYRMVFMDRATDYIENGKLFLIPDTILSSVKFPEKALSPAGLPLISLNR